MTQLEAILATLLTLITTGGLGGAFVLWVRARAKLLDAKAKATTKDADVSAKHKLAEIGVLEADARHTGAEADAIRAKAAGDIAMVDTVKQLRADVNSCKTSHAACEAALGAQTREISEMLGRVRVLEQLAGITPQVFAAVRPDRDDPTKKEKP